MTRDSRLATSSLRLATLLSLAMACQPAPGSQADVVVQHVTVIDGTDGPARTGMSVAITGQKISAIEADGRILPGPATRVIDGTGKFLIPGLWDMHVHLGPYGARAFPLFLANAVTSIRETGGDLVGSLHLRDAVRTGRVLGPQLLIAGPTLNGEVMAAAMPGAAESGATLGVTPSRAAWAVDSLADAGVDFIKVHAAVSRESWIAIMTAAKRRGLAVSGHVPDGMTPREVIEGGQRTIEHGSAIEFANATDGEVIAARATVALGRYHDSAGTGARPRDIIRMRLDASARATEAYDTVAAREFARYAAGREVWIDPTLVTYRLFVRQLEPELWDLPELRYVPRDVTALDITRPTVSGTPAQIAEGKRQWEEAKLSFRELVRARARFVAGTDAPVGPLVPGFSLQRELGLLAEIGLSPHEVLLAATRNAADAAGRLSEVGTIEVGKFADLVLLDANPLAEVRHLSRINAVVTRGRVLERAALDSMLAASNGK